MISEVLIFGLRGQILASRVYKPGLRRAASDIFRVQVITNPEPKAPVLTLGSTSFLHIKHQNLYLVAITRHDVDAALVFETLYKIVSAFESFAGKLDEATLTKRLTLMYELLDEAIDFGYPQMTSSEVLKPFICNMPKPLKRDAIESAATQATSATSWRRASIKYYRNEVFLDVLEDLNVVLQSGGTTLSREVNGRFEIKSRLSGMPQCEIGLTEGGYEHYNTGDIVFDGVENGAPHARLSDAQLNQCVDLEKYTRTGAISFVPPDGTFELMRYRAVDGVLVPFSVVANVKEFGNTRVEYEVTIKSLFDQKLAATNVVLSIPVPGDAADVSTKVGSGKAKFRAGQKHIEWRLGRMPGNVTHKLTAGLLRVSSQGEAWGRPPIKLDFNLAMYSASGLTVRYLRVKDKSNYTTLKWVRYLVSASSFEIRF